MYTRADVYEQYRDELDSLECDLAGGFITYSEYMQCLYNLDLWLEDELEELKGE